MDKAKIEVERKVSRLLKFIQNKNKIPKDSKRELLAIVNDLQEQCQSLYSTIDDFQQDLDPKLDGRRKEKSHIGSSSSDLEYYSSEDIENVVEEGIEISELEALRNEAEEKERELTSRVKELERELGDANDRNRYLEEEITMQATENKQLGEKNKGLRSQISGLELVLKEKGDEISTLVNKFGNSELGLTSRIEELKSQLRNLEQETGFLRARNSELAKSSEVKRVEVEGLMDQVNGMKDELESLRNQKDELASKLEEVTESKLQLKSLQEETEEQRIKLSEEIDYLRGENQKIHTRIAELESLHMETEANEIEYESNKLNIQVSDQKELINENQKLLTRIAELESVHMETEAKKADEIEDESNKSNIQVSDQKELIKEKDDIIRNQERLLKEQKDTIDKFYESPKHSKHWSLGSSRDLKLNPNAIERRMEELAEDFRMKIEDNLRILYRRIHVAEQIHLESKNEYIKSRELAQENRENRESLILFETHFKKIKDVWEKGYVRSMKKLDEAEENTKRVDRLVKEIDSARVWVTEKKSELETLIAKLECREAQESLLKEKLSKLEKKLAEEGKEKLSLSKVLSKFEAKIKELEINVKRRDVELLSLEEEKREAIRQLCIFVDYQRDRYDEIKKSIAKDSPKT